MTTRLRLRDGESNLLAGLLREDERKSLHGFPGAIHVPILKQLFSANDNSIAQTDIVMLLTPHIVRTHEITEEDLKPLYIGSQQNLGLGGPPALIAPQPAEAPAAAPPAATPPPAAPATPPNAIANPLPAMRRRARRPRWDKQRPREPSRCRPARRPSRAPCSCRRSRAATPPNVSTPHRAESSQSAGAGARTAPPAPAQPPSRPRRRLRRLESGSPRSFSRRLGRRFASAGAVQVPHLDHRSAASLDDHADVDVRPGQFSACGRYRRAASCARAASAPRSISR